MRILVLMFTVVCMASVSSSAQAADALAGQWSLDLPNEEAGWAEIRVSDDGKVEVDLLWAVGSARPVQSPVLKDGVVTFSKSIRRPLAPKSEAAVEYGIAMQANGDRLLCSMTSNDGVRTEFFGQRQPPMPPPPNLAEIEFASPVSLFDGKTLRGWTPHRANKTSGWSARDGVLVNSTPKTDFSAYGEFANIRTDAEFEDFQLHIEFRLPKSGGNSGIYLRGLYEVQVTHRDSSMQGIAGPGAVFGRAMPSTNAGKPAGEWETYDITLVDRHVTVIHNGTKVVDNAPIVGCTGGAIHSDVTKAGPIFLQGDHTSVEYRNITLRPRRK